MKDLLGTMRTKVMNMHTIEQRQGTLHNWKCPLPASYVQYLVESRYMHAQLQMAASNIPNIHTFDLVAPLERDILRISSTFDLPVPDAPKNGPGRVYARVLQAKSARTPALLSHWYLIHFAHLSGGSLVGARVSEALLEGHVPEFYRSHDGVVLDDIRAQLEKISCEWTEEQQWDFLAEAGPGFYHINKVSQSMFV